MRSILTNGKDLGFPKPFVKKISGISEFASPEQQIENWVSMIYFERKKISDIPFQTLYENPFHSMLSSSIVYSIIRDKLNLLCSQERKFILKSFQILLREKENLVDLKPSDGSWEHSWKEINKDKIDPKLKPVYQAIAHMICDCHRYLVEANQEIYRLWKIMYEISGIKDLQEKTIQKNLNEFILDQLFAPAENIDMALAVQALSIEMKEEFVYCEMWGYKRRKLIANYDENQRLFDQAAIKKANCFSQKNIKIEVGVEKIFEEKGSRHIFKTGKSLINYSEKEIGATKLIEKPQRNKFKLKDYVPYLSSEITSKTFESENFKLTGLTAALEDMSQAHKLKLSQSIDSDEPIFELNDQVENMLMNEDEPAFAKLFLNNSKSLRDIPMELDFREEQDSKPKKKKSKKKKNKKGRAAETKTDPSIDKEEVETSLNTKSKEEDIESNSTFSESTSNEMSLHFLLDNLEINDDQRAECHISDFYLAKWSNYIAEQNRRKLMSKHNKQIESQNTAKVKEEIAVANNTMKKKKKKKCQNGSR